MISSINEIKFKPHRTFEGGIQTQIEMDGFIISIISGGRKNGIGGSYGHIVEDFTIGGKDLSHSTFEMAIFTNDEKGNFVTHKFFPIESDGDQVAGFLSADKVVEMLNELGHHHQLLFSQE
tara:strand:- start:761 stop:1123 length:363 start_codon:yes stop_codon:yes gene_type:complete